MIYRILRNMPSSEVDYAFLMSLLSKYKKPRDVITRLLKFGAIIRVKKGLYVIGPEYSSTPYSLETLANLIYGPSYISMEYALSFYGMIPERIEVVTSMTSKRNKFFKTPVGSFSYAYINPARYHVGVTQIRLDENHNTLMATKEKALADKIHATREIFSADSAMEYIIQDLRIERSALHELSIKRLGLIAKIYSSENVNALYQAVREVL